MVEMVKVLYEQRNTKFQGESSRPPRAECSPREEGNKNGDKPLEVLKEFSFSIHIEKRRNKATTLL